MYYDIPKTSSVYPDYYSVYNEENGKNYLCKQYSDIIDFFYEDKVTKGNIKYRLKNYTIWDIDKSWLPAIKVSMGQSEKEKIIFFNFNYWKGYSNLRLFCTYIITSIMMKMYMM